MTFGKNIQNTLEQSFYASDFVQVCFFYQLFVFQTGHWKWCEFSETRCIPVLSLSINNFNYQLFLALS